MEVWLTACGTPEEGEARQPLERFMQIWEPLQAREMFIAVLRGTLARWREEEEDGGMECLLSTLPALASDSTNEGSLPPGCRSVACLELAAALDEILADAWDQDTRTAFNELAEDLVSSPAFEVVLGVLRSMLAGAEPPEELAKLRIMLERSRLLALVDQLLFFEQDGDREQQHAYQACMASLSFPALARLVSPSQLCFEVQPRLEGKPRMQPTLNSSAVSCLEWWLCYSPGREEEELPAELCLGLLQRLTALMAAHMPIATAASEMCGMLGVMVAVLDKCLEVVEPFFQSDACTIMAQATAACLRRARLAQFGQRRGTFAAGEHSALPVPAVRALQHMQNTILCAEELPEDEDGAVHVPPALLAAFTCLREATAGSWSGDLEVAVPTFFVAARMGVLRRLASAAAPLASDAWVEAAEGIVAADAPLVELVVSMAQEGAEAAAAAAASETSSESSSRGSIGGSSEEDAGSPGSVKEGSELDAEAAPNEASEQGHEKGAGAAGGVSEDNAEGGEEGAGAADSCSESSREGEGSCFHSSSLVASCLLLRSMARSAYTTAKAEPAVGFLRRFVQLAGTGSEVAWCAQLLLRPVLLVLSKVLPTVPLDKQEPALAAMSAAVQAAVALPPDPAWDCTAALVAALQAIAAGAGSTIPGGTLVRHFLSADCLPAVMRCLQHGSALLQQGGSAAASGRQLVDQALRIAVLLSFPAFQRPKDGLGIVVVRQQVPSLLRQAALQLATAISPAELLQVAVLAEGQPPAPGPAPASQPLLGAVVLGAVAAAQGQQAQQAQQAQQQAQQQAVAAGGEADGEVEQGEGEDAAAGEEDAAGEGDEEDVEAQMADLVHHALGELMALLFGLNIGAGGSTQGPPRNHLAEEALLLAAAATLHCPAARAALLGQPGALDCLVAMLRRCCSHATQDQQASFCATLIGALDWHGDSAAQQLVDAGTVDAVLHALHVALSRTQPAPALVEPAFAILRTACFATLAALASQAGPAGRLLCQAIVADSGLLEAVRQAAERPPNASVRAMLSTVLEVAAAVAGGMPRDAVVAQHARALQQVAAYASDAPCGVYADLTRPAQMVHVCAAQLGAGRLPFSGTGVVAGLDSAAACFYLILNSTPSNTEELGIETDQTIADLLRATSVLPPLLACLRWLVREAQEAAPHVPVATLLTTQQHVLVLTLCVAERGPRCAALVAQAGGRSVAEAILKISDPPSAGEEQEACCVAARRLGTLMIQGEGAAPF
ncbi:hypothetical protein C2E21_4941 [Chlorella sorokiniana]|uniref:Uncharacterized protein n=1 Tax=Chlorella sorokiniana TaxID=3076 RepID=A0A2P6TQE9_CHLSO|nr:hypothetical protein C2E21_4941 [Chlorella sorokiniana]|eukprot:PRW56260.1 hypothetical protein C2E21_4941 [Chlorella sorokiniana]